MKTYDDNLREAQRKSREPRRRKTIDEMFDAIDRNLRLVAALLCVAVFNLVVAVARGTNTTLRDEIPNNPFVVLACDLAVFFVAAVAIRKASQ